MRRGWLLLLVLISVTAPGALRAQTQATSLESLSVEIWPDYDRPQVLVLLSGAIGAATSLPAVVAIPVPEEASLNAVARIDSAERMIDDVPYSFGGGAVTLTTPDPRFRVEYYVPYRVEEGVHSFTYTWRAGLSVDQLTAVVQQPAFATSLLLEPAAAQVVQGRGGLSYHALPATSVPPDTPFSVQVFYPMSAQRLSVEKLRQPQSPRPAPPVREAEAGMESEGGLGWAAVATAGGALILAAAFAWQIARSRAARPSGSSEPAKEPSEVRFCSACGKPFGKADRFCRHCGAERA